MSRRGAVDQQLADLGLHGLGERGVGRDQDRGRVGAVLGLGDEVRGHATGVGRRRGEDHALGRPGRQVDADLARDLDLRGRDPGVARADDPVDRREPRVREPVRQRADRLGAAGDDERIDLEQPGRAEQHRVVAAIPVRGRRDDDPLDPGDAGRHDGHDQRRGVRRGAARDVRPDRG